jgi:hypothetical protein
MKAWGHPDDFDDLEPLSWLEWVPIGILVALVFALIFVAGTVAR